MNEIFSANEQKVLKILGKRKMTISEITEKFYDGSEMPPLNPGNVVAGAIRRINKKCQYHRLDWFLNGVGIGRGGKSVWKDRLP